MIAEFINPLIQIGSWQYDLIFVDENEVIQTRITTQFNSEPVQSDLEERVYWYNDNWQLGYTIDSIQFA